MSDATVGSRVLKTYEGNTRTFVFQLRQKNSRAAFDASGAAKFKFEVERHDPNGETPFAPIEVLPAAPGANFAGGIIPVTVGTTITVKGSYLWSLTMVVGATDVTVATGQLEVAERPGYPPPAP